MTDKERLEMIKNAPKYPARNEVFGIVKIYKNDFYWLIEQAEEARKLKEFYDYFSELYGKGLEVANWHMNGDLEPFDNFFDSAEEEMN